MKQGTLIKKCLCTFAFMLIFALGQGAVAEVTVETVNSRSDVSNIAYPKIKGLSNAFIQDKINDAMKDVANITGYESLAQAPGGSGVTVSHESWLLEVQGQPAVISTVVQAEGKMLNGRIGCIAYPMMFDLRSGEKISADAIYTSKERAQAFFDQWAERYSHMDEYTYLDLSMLTPVPIDRVVLTDSGMRCYYPQDSLVMLSGRTGSFDFHFNEVEEILNRSDGSLIASLDVWHEYRAGEKTATRLNESVQKGCLPGVPDVMGKNITELLKTYKELNDPEALAGGEQYFPEAPAFRGISLAVRDGSETVNGILARRIDLYGLATDQATKKDCIKLLGEGYTELTMDQNAAEHYGMPAGTALTKTIGSYQLLMGFDENDILRAVYLSNSN